jgi:hypothetical protein
MGTRKRPATAAVAEPTVYGPDNGGNAIFRAWQGLYHLFGARVERFDITDGGIFAVGLTVDEKYGTPDEIVNALAKSDRSRLDFIPLYFWATGQTPADFTSSLSLTQWLTKHMHGTGKGRSPQFAKDAIADYKARVGLAVPRGRPRKATVKIAELGELDATALEGVEISELTKLKETLEGIISPTKSEPVAVPA